MSDKISKLSRAEEEAKEAVDEEEEANEEDTEEKCRVDMWRCLSKVDISLIAGQ